MDLTTPVAALIAFLPPQYHAIAVSIVSWLVFAGVVAHIIVGKLPKSVASNPRYGWLVKVLYFLGTARFSDEPGTLKLPMTGAAQPVAQPSAQSQSGRVDVATMLFLSSAFIVMASLGAVLLGCPTQVVPTDSGAPSWQPGAVISLSISSAAIEEAIATEGLTGLTGSDLTDYDAALHIAHDGVATALDHVIHGASPCTLHADAARAADGFARVAQILSGHGKAIPSNIVNGAGRLIAVLEVALPPCSEDAGAVSPAARLRTAYAVANIAHAIPARLETP